MKNLHGPERLAFLLLGLAATLALSQVALTEPGDKMPLPKMTDSTDANIGWAYGSGTTAKLFWIPYQGDSGTPIGFVVAKSYTPNPEDFFQLSGLLSLSTKSYDDEGLSPGWYYYCIVIVYSDYSYEPWTPILSVYIEG
jgi:hypothetical protein